MRVARPLYERMGFRRERDIPPIFGVPMLSMLKRRVPNNALQRRSHPERGR
jgi:hypothetical protein